MPARFVDLDRQTPMFLPYELREWVPAGHIVHFILDAVEQRPIQANASKPAAVEKSDHHKTVEDRFRNPSRPRPAFAATKSFSLTDCPNGVRRL
jgi:hypothetical protein